MTREDFFKKVVVKKDNHFCMFCYNDGKKCTELLKNKIGSEIDM